MPQSKLDNCTVTAKAAGVSPRTLHSYAKAGRVPSYRIGSRRLFDIEEVIAAIKAGKTAPAK